MAANGFISFPTIDKIGVHNYPLFEYGNSNNWSTMFGNGLNLFLGANSIGKTTTINMVIYGILGDFKNAENTEVNANFFQQRLLPFERNIPNQLIEIEFSVESSVINIQRSLKKDKIEKLLITENGQEKKILISEYNDYLRKISKIDDISDLAFVLSYLIIREEEGNYLLWQKEEQYRVFSILLNQVGFHSELTTLQKRFDQADINHKSAKEKFNSANKMLEYFREKQKDQLTSFNIISDITKFEEQLKNKKEEREKIESTLKEKREKASIIQKEVETLNNKYILQYNNLQELQDGEKDFLNKIEEYNNILMSIEYQSSTINISSYAT